MTNMAEYKVLLTTSGLGSRLGNLTKFTNKSLVRVGDKPAISYIIESYPKNVEFVVTIGHYGSHVKQYLSMVHADRKIQFVEVDNYMGEGSSLLYSISLCEEHLQCPFVFHACDTILPKNYIKDIDFSSNWSIGGDGENSQAYRTINCVNGKIASINEKGEQNFDYVYIGVSGFKDYVDRCGCRFLNRPDEMIIKPMVNGIDGDLHLMYSFSCRCSIMPFLPLMIIEHVRTFYIIAIRVSDSSNKI